MAADEPGMDSLPQTAGVRFDRPKNRRRGDRHRLSIPATLFDSTSPQGAAGKPVAVTITQLSVNGLAFRSKTAVDLNGTFQLESFDTLITPHMKIRVVSQRQISDTEFEIGAEVLA